MNKILRLTLITLLAMVGIVGYAQTKIDFTQQTITTTDAGGFTLSASGFSFEALKNDGTTNPTQNGKSKDLRLYAKNTLKVSGSSMTSMTFTMSTQGKKRWADLTASTGSVTIDKDAGTTTWTATSAVAEVTFTVGEKATNGTDGASKAGQFDVNDVTIYASGTTPSVTVTAPEISGTTPFTDKTTVTITVPTGTTVYYTTDGSTPSDQGDDYQGPFEISATTTVKAVAYDSDGNHSSVVSKEFVKNVTTTGSGTEADPYTCADVIALVNGDAIPNDNVYVKGKVSTASTDTQANINKYHNATFYISDDGTTTNQVQAFRNKNLNNTNYTSTSEIPQLGDDVVLYGKPKKYGSTIELDAGNYLVSVTHNNVKVDTLSFTVSEALAQLTAGTQPTGVCYISGTVSQDVDTTGVAQYGNLTYYISNDGTETDQLEVFRGKSFNGEQFTSEFFLKKGDKVKILGRIINYTNNDDGTTTPEVASNSVLVEYNGVTTAITGIKGDETSVNAPAYNLAGQRVDKDYKGVVIQNGKKRIRK